jgi:hypothetical protein
VAYGFADVRESIGRSLAWTSGARGLWECESEIHEDMWIDADVVVDAFSEAARVDAQWIGQPHVVPCKHDESGNSHRGCFHDDRHPRLSTVDPFDLRLTTDVVY